MPSPTLSELMAQKAELEKQIAETQKIEHHAALTQIRDLMAQHGLTLADVSGKGRNMRSASKSGGGKVAPKYRDSATGDTWTGRGLKPKWLQSALGTGRSQSDFLI